MFSKTTDQIDGSTANTGSIVVCQFVAALLVSVLHTRMWGAQGSANPPASLISYALEYWFDVAPTYRSPGPFGLFAHLIRSPLVSGKCVLSIVLLNCCTLLYTPQFTPLIVTSTWFARMLGMYCAT